MGPMVTKAVFAFVAVHVHVYSEWPAQYNATAAATVYT